MKENVYRATWNIVVFAADSSDRSETEMLRLQKVLGGKVRLQNKVVEEMGKIRKHFWYGDRNAFSLKLPEDEVCRQLNLLRDLIEDTKTDVCLSVAVEFSTREDCAGFYIPGRIIAAAAAANASIDVPIDYIEDA